MSQSVKISTKIITSIFSSSLRAGENQTRMYGLLFGTKTYSTYHIKDCLFGVMSECEQKENEGNVFQTPSGAQTEALIESYLSTHPTESVLGGFTTDKEIFSELTVLNFVINKISEEKFSVHNDLVLLYDPSSNVINPNSPNCSIKVYKWTKETVNNKDKKSDFSLVSFEEKNWEISGSDDNNDYIINKDVITEEKLFYEIDDWEEEADKEIEKIIDEFAEIDSANFIGKDIKDGIKDKAEFIKRELFVCLKYLNKFDKFLNQVCSKDNLNDNEINIIDKIVYVMSSIKEAFEHEEVLSVIQTDVQRNKILNALVSLLNAQIKITEKVNYMQFGE